MKHFLIRDELFNQDFGISIDCGFKEYRLFIKKQLKLKTISTDCPTNQSCNGIVEEWQANDGRLAKFIWIKTFKKNTEFVGTLVHELKHLVDDVMRMVGIKEKSGNQETSAYYMEYLFKKIMNKIW